MFGEKKCCYESQTPPVAGGHPTFRGGFNFLFIVTPNPGEVIQFDSYFLTGLKPPPSFYGGYLFGYHPLPQGT